jgi:AcrR family transcriptional regulator
MPRTKTEAKRKAILDAAAKVFAQKGYHPASVADLAAEVGMGLGTFYRYFKNKLDVFHAVIDQVLLEVSQVVASEQPTDSTTLKAYRAQVERIGMGLFRAFDHNRQLARLLFVEAPGIDAELNAKLRESVVLFGQMTQAYLENGVARGFLRAGLDTETTALAVNAMIFEGVRHVAIAQDPEAGRERWSKAVIAMMFSGISRAS